MSAELTREVLLLSRELVDEVLDGVSVVLVLVDSLLFVLEEELVVDALGLPQTVLHVVCLPGPRHEESERDELLSQLADRLLKDGLEVGADDDIEVGDLLEYHLLRELHFHFEDLPHHVLGLT